ncbi:MAG: hypothetical protein GF344_16740 [Chitinivibrionales bacterium]|nr:hypothetical protein [Chitinivibrionales bacterium]
MKLKCKILLAVWAVLMIVSCGEFEPVSPYDPEFETSYGLEFREPVEEKVFEVFKPCSLTFDKPGEYMYWLIEVTPPSILDTALFNASYSAYSDAPVDDSLMVFYFLRPYDDTLAFKCLHHAKNTDGTDRYNIKEYSVTAVNPYYIDGPSTCARGDTVSYRIARTDQAPSPSRLKVLWNGDETPISVNTPLCFAAENTVEVTAILIDERGHRLPLPPELLSVEGSRPVIGGVTLPGELTLGDTLGMTVQAASPGPWRLVARVREAVVNDTTRVYSGSSVAVTATAPVVDTGNVTIAFSIVDTLSGLRSAVYDTTVAVSYSLPVVEFSDSMITVPAEQEFVVTVAGEAARYHWRSTGVGIDDTTETGTLSLNAGKDPFKLIVYGIDRFGYNGPSDTLTIEPQTFAVTIAFDSVPVYLQAGEQCTVSVTASGGNPTYTWSFDPAPDHQDIDGARAAVAYDDSVFSQVTVRVFGVEGTDTSNTVATVIPLREHRPSLHFDDESYAGVVNVPVTFRVTSHDSNGTVTQIRYRKAGGQTQTMSADVDTFTVTFGQSGASQVEAWCVDNHGFSSSRDTANVTITADKPYFVSPSVDTMLYLHDTLALSIRAEAGVVGETVEGYFWMADGGVIHEAHGTTPHEYRYACETVGAETLTVYAVNSLGDTTEGQVHTVVINAGEPVVDTAWVDKKEAWLETPVTVAVSARDVNGGLTAIEIDWSGDDLVDSSLSFATRKIQSTNIALSFGAEGDYPIRLRATDIDGYHSDWYDAGTVSVTVGRPVVNGLTLSHDTTWVKDSVTLMIEAQDPNGSVASYRVRWSAEGEEQTATNAELTYAWPTPGTHTISVQVVDDEGLVSAAKTTEIVVRLGAPKVDSVVIDVDTIWVVDTNEYRVYASDVNSDVDSFQMSFDMGATWKSADSREFFHAWDTSESGAQRVIARVMDDDSVWAADTIEVFVRLGRPIIFARTFGDSMQYVPGSSGIDTIFYVNSQNINSTVQIAYSDTNGQFARFFWDWAANGTINATTTTTTTTSDGFEEGDGRDLIVYSKDEDSLQSNSLRLYVYHDAPPPAPTFFDRGIDGDSTVLKWGRKLDVYDGVQTKVQIAYCFGEDCAPEDSLYASGAEPTLEEIEEKWGTQNIGGIDCNVLKAVLPQSGAGRWRVILIDARGSRTPAPATDPATFVAP